MSPSGKPPSPDNFEYDPVYLHSLRETFVIIGMFGVCVIWSIYCCYNFGYMTDGQQVTISTVMGMPAWAFWGILVPWIVVDVAAVWFCFFYMAADDLGEAHEGEDLAEQIAHDHEDKEASND